MLLNSFKLLKDRQKKFGWQNRQKAQMEKISVIIPVYNSAKYLSACVESVRTQTYTNLEIVLVDDKSTDNSLAICKELATKDKRIVILAHEKNMGVSAARNTGIDMCTGDFIAFCDADDMLEKNMLDTLKKASEVNRADVAVCDISFLYEGDIRKKNKYANGETEIVSGKEFDLCYFMYPDMLVENISAWNKLYNKKVFDNVRFPVDRINEDESTTFKLVNSSDRVVYVHEALYIYRKATKEVLGSDFTNKRFQIFDAYIERMKFYQENAEYDMLWYTIKRYMYRLYDYKMKAKIAGCYERKLVSQYVKPIREYYKRNNDFLPIKSRDRKQVALFMTSFDIYCVLKNLQP